MPYPFSCAKTHASSNRCLNIRNMLIRALSCSLGLFLSLASAAQTTPKPPAPIPVKVVVVAMFEVGADMGDVPGELQFWVEGDHLDQIIPLPAAYHDARM